MAMISLKVFSLLTLMSLCSELFFNDKALVVYYQGEFHFPFIQNSIPAKTFGLDTQSEANYLDLQKQFRQKPEDGNWLMMPFIPYHYRSVSQVDSTPIDLELKNKEEFYNKQIEQLQQNLEANKHQIYELKLTRNHALGKIDSKKYHPLPPTLSKKHFFGTDSTGRDILAQLSYGYRIAPWEALPTITVRLRAALAPGAK